VLLAVQVAISVVLLVNAGLLVQAMRRAQAIDPGFDVRNVTVLSVDLPASEYSGPRTEALTRDLLTQLERFRDLPVCGLALNPPLSNATYRTSIQPSRQPGSPTLLIYSNDISGGYLDAVGMHLLAGRNFVPEDSARNVMMINEAAAKRWWPGESPLGKTIVANGGMRQIVGIASDAYANDLSSVEAEIYFPITGHWGPPFILVHDKNAASVDRIAALVKQIEPRAEVHAEPLSDNFRRKLQPSIYGSELAGLLGTLALVIASVGMSGVFAYVVGQRTREIGVRMALGARPSQIVRLVLGSSARALFCGLVCGIVCAAGISVLLAHGLPGISSARPVGIFRRRIGAHRRLALASAAPARRAANVDPVRALRWE
jgi:putative ABC transport system permease protein